MSAAPHHLPLATKIRILDAAEKLFGESGFDATSLRDITTEAQVNLAAVNYHFQSKESLIDAVIERRITPANTRRMEMLAAAGPSPTIEQIVEAFVAPMLMKELRPAVPLLGRALSQPNQFVERVFKKHFSGIAELFIQAISTALPQLSRDECFWRLQFMIGSMTHILALSSVLPYMQRGTPEPLEIPPVVRRLTAFVAAGMHAPATQFYNQAPDQETDREKH